MRIDSCGRRLLATLAVLLLGGCVSERIVLLPAPDGRPTAITVRDSRGEVVLDQPFAGVERRGNEFKVLKSSEVMVIGHTDTVGGTDANDKLSQKRAAAVREILIAAGVPAQKIETAGRGERELLVMSADEVAEPRNRRVEISVR